MSHLARVCRSAVAVACLSRAAAAQAARVVDVDQRTPGSPLIVGMAPLTGREDIAVRSHVVPSRVYVGQQATYEVGVFLSDESRERMRRNPEFVPPEMRSMLTYDLTTPSQVPARVVNGRRYEVHVFRRALFPLAAGTLDIPPARLNYALPLSTSFFSREELHTERTLPSTLTVLDPPAANRPRNYRGAVGRLSVESRVDNRRGRVGDPLLMTVIVSGVGNISLVPRPEVSVPWGDAVAGAERIRIDSTGVLVGGRKEFDFLVTPRRPGSLVLPAIEYAFFDPDTAAYQVAKSSPIDVEIAPGSAVAADRANGDSVTLLPIRREFRGELPPPIPSSTWYWLAIVMAPLPALVIAVLRRPRAKRVETPVTRIRAMATNDTIDPSALRRDFALAVTARIPGAAATFSNHSRLERTLRRAGVSTDVAAEAGRLLAELDDAVFGNAPAPPGDVARRVDRVLQFIDQEALSREDIRRSPHRIATVIVFALSALGTGAALGLAATSPSQFADAVRAYDARDLPRAAALFEAVAEAQPRAADAWANAGSVAWQLGDTAKAAVGWQRALRLEPLAEDVRNYLGFTASFRDDLFGDVPPIPLSGLAVVGALLWLAGWYVAMLARASRVRRPIGGALLGSAFVAALIGLVLNDIAHGRHAAIVATAGRLRSSPALNAEGGPEVVPGELVRTTGEQTAWTRVSFRDGRAGWMQTRDLLSLETK